MTRLVVEVNARDRPLVSRRYSLRWDEDYGAFVLTHPDAIIKLNRSAAEILKRCDGAHSVADVVDEVRALYTDADKRLESSVYRFLEIARARGWVEVQ